MSAQDGMFEQYWRLVFNLIKEHSASCCHYTSSFPCLLAGMTHQTAALRNKSLAAFRQHAEAYERATTMAWPAVQRLLKKHPLQSTCMKIGLLCMRASGWSLGHAQVQEWLGALFDGPMSTVPIEQSGKVLRDGEIRDAPHKSMHLVGIYEKLINSGLLELHDRQNIQIASGVTPPAGFYEKAFFPGQQVVEGGSNGDGGGADIAGGAAHGKVELKAILGNPDWPSYTAQSVRIVYGQLAALLDLHRRDMWEHAADLWATRLLVENTFVSLPARDLRGLVVLVVDEAALLWPLERIGNHTYRLDMAVHELTWVCIYSADEVQVISCGSPEVVGHICPEFRP